MHSDDEHEDNDITNRRDIEFKVERLREQSQIYLNQLILFKRQLNDINRLNQFDTYVQKLNEIGKIVQNLVQNIRNIEQLYSQLNEKERIKLDRQINLLRTEINREKKEFYTIRNQAMASSSEENLSSTNDNTTEQDTIPNDNTTEQDTVPNELRQRHITTNRLNESYNSLEQDLIVLRETIDEVAQLVAQHKEKISHTEQVINIAHDRIRDASTLLQRAVHNRYVTVASGALLGATLGGPVGFMMGLKVGALVALSGSAVGALSANLIQQKMTKHDEPKDTNTSYNQAML